MALQSVAQFIGGHSALLAVTVIHPWLTLGEGAYPRAALLPASDGNLYGTTERGGDRDHGTRFGMTLAGQIVSITLFPETTVPILSRLGST